MRRLRRNPLVVAACSVVFHICSLAVVAVFLPFLVLVWAPLRVGWPVWHGFVRAQLWLLRVICGQRVVLDLAAVPEGPVILACRHESLWESFALPLALGNPVIFAKAETFAMPVAAQVARKFGYIGLDRTGDPNKMRAAFDEARARAAEGRSFLIFPNGTRDPAHRFRVQKGVAVLYRGLGLPVVPIVVDSGRYWPHRSLLRRPGTVRARALPVIPAGLRTSEFLTRLEADLAEPA